jgi:hypothetical protein
VPVVYPSRWSWSFHLFLGRPVLLFPFGLYFSACLGILSVSILSTCCSHSRWYCFIFRTVFCTPSSSLTDWFLSLSNLVIPSKCLKISFVLLPVFFHLVASAPRLHNRTLRNFIYCIYCRAYLNLTLHFLVFALAIIQGNSWEFECWRMERVLRGKLEAGDVKRGWRKLHIERTDL